ncbi:MAG: Dynein heavy chain 3, axonemal, partial [Paramarteilia canceri]
KLKMPQHYTGDKNKSKINKIIEKDMKYLKRRFDSKADKFKRKTQELECFAKFFKDKQAQFDKEKTEMQIKISSKRNKTIQRKNKPVESEKINDEIEHECKAILSADQRLTRAKAVIRNSVLSNKLPEIDKNIINFAFKRSRIIMRQKLDFVDRITKEIRANHIQFLKLHLDLSTIKNDNHQDEFKIANIPVLTGQKCFKYIRTKIKKRLFLLFPNITNGLNKIHQYIENYKIFSFPTDFTINIKESEMHWKLNYHSFVEDINLFMLKVSSEIYLESKTKILFVKITKIMMRAKIIKTMEDFTEELKSKIHNNLSVFDLELRFKNNSKLEIELDDSSILTRLLDPINILCNSELDFSFGSILFCKNDFKNEYQSIISQFENLKPIIHHFVSNYSTNFIDHVRKIDLENMVNNKEICLCLEKLHIVDKLKLETKLINDSLANIGFFKLKTTNLREDLFNFCEKSENLIDENSRNIFLIQNLNIDKFFNKIVKTLSQPISNIDELTALESYRSKRFEEEKSVLNNLIAENIMKYLDFIVLNKDFKESDIESLLKIPDKIKEAVKINKLNIFSSHIQSKSDNLKGELSSYLSEINVIAVKCKEISTLIEDLNKKELAIASNAKSEFELFEKLVVIIKISTKALSHASSWYKFKKKLLNSPIRELGKYQTIRLSLNELENMQEKVMDVIRSNISELTITDSDLGISTRRGSLERSGSILKKDPIAIQTICKIIGDDIADFKKYEILLQVFCSEGFEDRHWSKLFAITGEQKLLPGSNISIQDLDDFDMEKYNSSLLEIESLAKNEFILQNSYEKICSEFIDLKFPSISSEKFSYDKIIEELEYQITKMNMIKYSRSVYFMESKVYGMLTDLMKAKNFLELTLKVFKEWQRIQPIFGNKTIHSQFNNEKKIFDSITSTLDEIEKFTSENIFVHKLSNLNDFHDTLEKSMLKLDQISLEIEKFAVNKREIFPRLYFISSEEIINLILSCDSRGCPNYSHFSKLFNGIKSYEVNHDSSPDFNIINISGVYSHLDEELKLINPVKLLNDESTLIYFEKFLCNFELEMVNSVKTSIFHFLNSSAEQSYVPYKEENKVVSQIFRLSEQIKFFGKIDEIFSSQESENANEALEKLKKQINLYIREGCKILGKGDSKNLNLTNQIIQNINNLNILENLMKSNLKFDKFNQNFCFISIPKYKISKDGEIVLNFVTDIASYGYELIRADLRNLIITPATDRCFSSLFFAIKSRRFSLIKGPSGVGKTETIKEISKILGVQSFNLICTGRSDSYSLLSRILQGMCNTGFWVCLDEIDNLNGDIMKSIFEIINSIAEAYRLEQNKIKIGNIDWRIDKNNLLLSMISKSGFSECGIFPSNLKNVLKFHSIILPDIEKICSGLLICANFSNPNSIVKKILWYSKKCEVLFQNHLYDFGLRNCISLIETMKKIRSEYPDMESNDEVLAKSIRNIERPKIYRDDRTIHDMILSELFNESFFDSKNYSQKFTSTIESFFQTNGYVLDPNIYSKCLELNEVSCYKTGIILLGKAGTGKTLSIKCLNYLKNPKIFKTIYPNGLSQDQLFGNRKTESKKNIQGLISTFLLRQCEGQSKSTNNGGYLVLNGEFHQRWMDYLIELVDEHSKSLKTPNGETLNLDENGKIIFKSESLSSASVSLVSRCGIIYYSHHPDYWTYILGNFLLKSQQFLNDKERDLLVEMKNLLVKLLKEEFNDINPVLIRFSQNFNNILYFIVENLFEKNEISNINLVNSFIHSLMLSIPYFNEMSTEKNINSKKLVNVYINSCSKIPQIKPLIKCFPDNYSIECINYKTIGKNGHWEESLKYGETLEIDFSNFVEMISLLPRQKNIFKIFFENKSTWPNIIFYGQSKSGISSLMKGIFQQCKEKILIGSENVYFDNQKKYQALSTSILNLIDHKREKKTDPINFLGIFVDHLNENYLDRDPMDAILSILDNSEEYLKSGCYTSCNLSFTISVKSSKNIRNMGKLFTKFIGVNINHPSEIMLKQIFSDQLIKLFEPNKVSIDIQNFISSTSNFFSKIVSSKKTNLNVSNAVMCIDGLSNICKQKIFDQDLLKTHLIKRVEETLNLSKFYLEETENTQFLLKLLKDNLSIEYNIKKNSQINDALDQKDSDINTMEIGNKLSKENFPKISIFTNNCRILLHHLKSFTSNPGCNGIIIHAPNGIGKRTTIKEFCRINGTDILILSKAQCFDEEKLIQNISIFLNEKEKKERTKIIYIDKFISEDFFTFIDNQTIEEYSNNYLLKFIYNIAIYGANYKDIHTNESIECGKMTLIKPFLIFNTSNLSGEKLNIDNTIANYTPRINQLYLDDFTSNDLHNIASFLMENDENEAYKNLACSMHNIARAIYSKNQSLTKCDMNGSNFYKFLDEYRLLSKKKRNGLTAKINKLSNGLATLVNSSEYIKKNQNELENMAPKLAEYSKNLEENISEINKESAVVEVTLRNTEKAKCELEEQLEIAHDLEEICNSSLQKVIPEYEASLAALNTIKATDLAILKNLRSPPAAIIKVMHAVCCLIGIVKLQNDEEDVWAVSKKVLNEIGFMSSLKNFDKDNIDANIISHVKERFLNDKDFNPESISAVSQAAEGICRWVISIEKYHIPKRESIKSANEKAKILKIDIEKSENILKNLREKLDDLELRNNKYMVDKTKIEKEISLCESRLVNSQELMISLTEHINNWKEKLEIYQAMSNEESLGIEKDFKISEKIDDKLLIEEWFSLGLPNETTCVENMAINRLSNCNIFVIYDPSDIVKKLYCEDDHRYSIISLNVENIKSSIIRSFESGLDVVVFDNDMFRDSHVLIQIIGGFVKTLNDIEKDNNDTETPISLRKIMILTNEVNGKLNLSQLEKVCFIEYVSNEENLEEIILSDFVCIERNTSDEQLNYLKKSLKKKNLAIDKSQDSFVTKINEIINVTQNAKDGIFQGREEVLQTIIEFLPDSKDKIVQNQWPTIINEKCHWIIKLILTSSFYSELYENIVYQLRSCKKNGYWLLINNIHAKPELIADVLKYYFENCLENQHENFKLWFLTNQSILNNQRLKFIFRNTTTLSIDKQDLETSLPQKKDVDNIVNNIASKVKISDHGSKIDLNERYEMQMFIDKFLNTESCVSVVQKKIEDGLKVIKSDSTNSIYKIFSNSKEDITHSLENKTDSFQEVTCLDHYLGELINSESDSICEKKQSLSSKIAIFETNMLKFLNVGFQILTGKKNGDLTQLENQQKTNTKLFKSLAAKYFILKNKTVKEIANFLIKNAGFIKGLEINDRNKPSIDTSFLINPHLLSILQPFSLTKYYYLFEPDNNSQNIFISLINVMINGGSIKDIYSGKETSNNNSSQFNLVQNLSLKLSNDFDTKNFIKIPLFATKSRNCLQIYNGSKIKQNFIEWIYFPKDQIYLNNNKDSIYIYCSE